MALMTSRVMLAEAEDSVWALTQKLWAVREGACGLR